MKVLVLMQLLIMSLFSLCPVEGKMEMVGLKEKGYTTEEELSTRLDQGPDKPRKFREENNVLVLVSLTCF